MAHAPPPFCEVPAARNAAQVWLTWPTVICATATGGSCTYSGPDHKGLVQRLPRCSPPLAKGGPEKDGGARQVNPCPRGALKAACQGNLIPKPPFYAEPDSEIAGLPRAECVQGAIAHLSIAAHEPGGNVPK